MRTLERNAAAEGMPPARLSFDLWRPVSRQRITASVTVLRDGRKARTVESSLAQDGKPVARCTGVFLKADATVTPVAVERTPPTLGPDAGRTLPPQVKAWSPFFAGVDTRVVEGDLLEPGPAAAWFHQTPPLVDAEPMSPLSHAVSAADLTVVLWRVPRVPWILLSAETCAGDRGTGVARGTLSDADGPFGAWEQTLQFEKCRPTA